MREKEEELKTKIEKLVRDKFDGDYRKGFDHYVQVDGEDSKIGTSALEKLLADANVGNWMTRTLWAEGVLKALGKDKEGAISWEEFEAILEEDPPIEPEQARGPGGRPATDT